MKKLTVFLLAAALSLSLTACGGNGNNGGNVPVNDSSPDTTDTSPAAADNTDPSPAVPDDSVPDGSSDDGDDAQPSESEEAPGEEEKPAGQSAGTPKEDETKPEAKPEAKPEPKQEAAPPVEVKPEPEPDPEPVPAAPEPEPEPAPEPADPKAAAQSLIGHSVSELYAAVGQPISSDYAPSCLDLDGGEDGELVYDGFTVYTFRKGNTETVDNVF